MVISHLTNVFPPFDFQFLSPPNQGLATIETFLGLMPVLVHDGVPFKETACIANYLFLANKMAKFHGLSDWRLVPCKWLVKSFMTFLYTVCKFAKQKKFISNPCCVQKHSRNVGSDKRGKDPTSRPHVTLGIKGSSQWIVTGSLIAAPMHMVKTSIWAKYLDDVSGKNNLWAYKYCILPVGVKLHASRSPHHLKIWLQAF